ncbi:DNA-directed RNA polymerase subunit omega [Proteinivorax hydrogeniformans]|uniref:DNA-directed RNA polymerase subunit omega n=1 Tax=Proteinivorax hydrogeniformans TaxID=1826727 RepID=A0AAU8HQ82_9FIRM
MIYPSIDDLLKKVDNKYALVVLAAKRSRELLLDSQEDMEEKNKKTVTIALEEVLDEKITVN